MRDTGSNQTIVRQPGIKLVGGTATISTKGDGAALGSFYGELFERLQREVASALPTVHYIGFRARRDSDTEIRFLGVEVPAILNIPSGMVAWDLESAERITIVGEGCNSKSAQHRDPLEWKWAERGVLGTAGNQADTGWIGEFWLGPRRQFFSLTANAYSTRGVERQATDDVELVPHDPSWEKEFAAFRGQLLSILGPATLPRVEHFGSTAVPGICAKPIIDVLIEIPSFEVAAPVFLGKLNRAEWEYWWYNDHMTFVHRNGPMGRRLHHVHVAPAWHEVWKGLIFRDYLRMHPKRAMAYQALKERLAARFSYDREQYTIAKAKFVRDTIRLAETE